MIKLEVQMYNRKQFYQTWELTQLEFGAGDTLSYALHNSVAYYAAEAERLVRDLITCAAAEYSSPLQRIIPQLCNLIIDLSAEALRREDVTGFGEIQPHESADEWSWKGRMESYESLAYAYWFKTGNSSSDYWLKAAKAKENYYRVKGLDDVILEECLAYLFMSGDYQTVRDYYFRYEKNAIDIQNCQTNMIRSEYSIIYLCAEYELQGRPLALLPLLQKKVSILYNRAQDWRISSSQYLIAQERMIFAFLHGRYIAGQTDPIVLAQGLRGF